MYSQWHYAKGFSHSNGNRPHVLSMEQIAGDAPFVHIQENSHWWIDWSRKQYHPWLPWTKWIQQSRTHYSVWLTQQRHLYDDSLTSDFIWFHSKSRPAFRICSWTSWRFESTEGTRYRLLTTLAYIHCYTGRKLVDVVDRSSMCWLTGYSFLQPECHYNFLLLLALPRCF